MSIPSALLLAGLLPFAAPSAAEDSWRLPPGMTFHRRPTAPGPEPVHTPVEGGTEGQELHCGHIRYHVARATPEQMTCIRGVVRGFIREGGNIHFTEDTCDLRAVVILQRMRATCGYHGAYLLLYNRDGSQDLSPGVGGATRNEVEWGAHWVAGAVDADGACFSLDPALGRLEGGVIPFREHLAMTDQRGRAVLIQASRWLGAELGRGGQSSLCRADCLGNFSQALRGPDAVSDRGFGRAEAYLTCVSCTRTCVQRFGETLFKNTCENVRHPVQRR
ncbi:MAG: hypothetical protein HYZ75_19095 [Elusimicrobia bacterium]|nr:hypothetical protein [Elusimicrobiota bacterium]